VSYVLQLLVPSLIIFTDLSEVICYLLQFVFFDMLHLEYFDDNERRI